MVKNMKDIKINNMKMLRTILGLILLMLLMFVPAGCGKKKAETTTQSLVVVTTEATTEAVTEATTGETTEATTEVTTEAITEEETEEATAEISTEAETEASTESTTEEASEELLDKDGTYTSKEDVALYLHQYGELPSNFITKKEAKKLGWSGGSLEDYAPGKSIGGDTFGNREGVLPDYGKYHECDIDTKGKKKRGAKRIVYSDDGRIYYTDDHYETFELLYGEER